MHWRCFGTEHPPSPRNHVPSLLPHPVLIFTPAASSVGLGGRGGSRHLGYHIWGVSPRGSVQVGGADFLVGCEGFTGRPEPSFFPSSAHSLGLPHHTPTNWAAEATEMGLLPALEAGVHNQVDGSAAVPLKGLGGSFLISPGSRGSSVPWLLAASL